ncbi:MAG: aspartate aminotransferase family protein [Crocinitomicaceae bacterium]|nr:aspartate aminotransferase family protein [Crocinitomicaceae bacterium]
MNLFDVYPRFNINITHANGIHVYDESNQEYLDLYGGHGVISIGHTHPHYVKTITNQLNKIGFYSNSIEMPIQEQLAQKLGELSGYTDYDLFLSNSGAEANENALKLASFHTGRTKVVAFKNAFHGRMAATLNVTDNPKISAPINQNNFPVEFLDLNDFDALENALKANDVAAVIVEGIQGVGGLDMPTGAFLQHIEKMCEQYGAVFIMDEIQCGYGRSGMFFAHQHAGVKPHLISTAKGMGNGFPIGGVLISPEIKPWAGMLGTTFGGNHLACAAALAVLEVIESEKLMENAAEVGQQLTEAWSAIPQVKTVKGKGLMLGVELDFPIKHIRNKILNEYHIFTGSASNPNVLRILPPLTIQFNDIEPFTNALKELLEA